MLAAAPSEARGIVDALVFIAVWVVALLLVARAASRAGLVGRLARVGLAAWSLLVIATVGPALLIAAVAPMWW